MPKQSTWPKRLQKLGLIGLLLLAVNAVYQIYYRYIDPPKSMMQHEVCNLHIKPCTVVLPDKRKVIFAIQPRDIVLNKKLTMSVYLHNIKPQLVTLTLLPADNIQYVRDMTMQDGGNQQYTTVVQLDHIMANQAKWLALVRVHNGEQIMTFPFKFHAH